MKKLIDIHTHFLSKDYLDFLEQHNALLEDGFPMPRYDLKEHLELMKECNIEYSILSVSSPQPYFEGYDKESIEMCSLLNKQMANLKNSHFGFFAILPLPNVQASIQEALYALDTLRADGIKLASNSRGLYLGDKKLDPLMEVLNQKQAIITIHPHKPEPMNENVYSAGPIPLFEFISDTTRAVLNLIGNDVILRYPNIKWIIPHCGSFLPNIYDRFIGISKIRKEDIHIEESFKKLYFDVSGITNKKVIEPLLSITNENHILYGSDYPFTPKKQIIHNLEHLPDIDFYSNTNKMFQD